MASSSSGRRGNVLQNSTGVGLGAPIESHPYFEILAKDGKWPFAAGNIDYHHHAAI
jgi:hypothetical protein